MPDHTKVQELLDQPFPDELVEQFPQDGEMLDFVPWHRYAERLNRDFGRDWSMRVDKVEVAGSQLLLVVEVGIGGALRCGTGTADANKTSWGGAHAEAFSQAFRRACAAHGLGLYFYRDEAAASAGRPGVRGGAGAGDGGAVEEGPGDGPTKAQLERLAQLGESGAWNTPDLQEYRERVRANFTKPGVGKILREMKEEYREIMGEEFQPPTETS